MTALRHVTQQWYGTSRWKRRRRAWLRAYPLCAYCERAGRVEVATVVDHVEPHRGNEQLFWSGELQSLCSSCHSGIKQGDEARGYSTEIGLDGWPTDSRHPIHSGGKR
jgi:5-methylcytosine-specific restriction protein A